MALLKVLHGCKENEGDGVIYKRKEKSKCSLSAVCVILWPECKVILQPKQISEATHSIETRTVNIHIESN